MNCFCNGHIGHFVVGAMTKVLFCIVSFHTYDTFSCFGIVAKRNLKRTLRLN